MLLLLFLVDILLRLSPRSKLALTAIISFFFPFFSHGSFCLVEVNGRLREVRGGTIKFQDALYETQ